MSKLKQGDKIICINNTKSNFLEIGKKYTVYQMDSFTNRVYIAEYKRFSFLISRFVKV